MGDRVRADALDPGESLVSDGAPDRPWVSVPAPARCRVDHPSHAVNEARVVVEVALQRGSIFEKDAMPEAAGTERPEPAAANRGRDRVVRTAVIGELLAGCGDDAGLTVRARRGSALRVRGDARVRPRVDEDAARPQDPAGLFQGIDHALSWDASERPRQDHDVEGPVGERKVLSDADLEVSVRGAEVARLGAGEANRRRVRIDTEDL